MRVVPLPYLVLANTYGLEDQKNSNWNLNNGHFLFENAQSISDFNRFRVNIHNMTHQNV